MIWECNLHTRAPALPHGGFELIRIPSAPLSTAGTVALRLGYLQLLTETLPSSGRATLLLRVIVLEAGDLCVSPLQSQWCLLSAPPYCQGTHTPRPLLQAELETSLPAEEPLWLGPRGLSPPRLPRPISAATLWYWAAGSGRPARLMSSNQTVSLRERETWFWKLQKQPNAQVSAVWAVWTLTLDSAGVAAGLASPCVLPFGEAVKGTEWLAGELGAPGLGWWVERLSPAALSAQVPGGGHPHTGRARARPGRTQLVFSAETAWSQRPRPPSSLWGPTLTSSALYRWRRTPGE